MSVNGAGLTSLQKLKLTDNRLERIQAGAFPSGSSATLRLELAENPLHCDCGLAWLLSWPDTTLARARCQYPPPLQGVLVSSIILYVPQLLYLQQKLFQCYQWLEIRK